MRVYVKGVRVMSGAWVGEGGESHVGGGWYVGGVRVVSGMWEE